MFRLSLISATFLLSLLSGCQSDNASKQINSDYQFSSKAVYTQQQDSASEQAPPLRFTPVYTEMVARHGARSLSSPKYDVLTKQV